MRLGLIGGGNMAAALIGGLRRRGGAAGDFCVVEVDPDRRAVLQREFGVAALVAAGAPLRDVDLIVLAVKPPQMREACETVRPWLGRPFVLSIAAGIPAASVAAWCGTEAVVRAMPNTPALIGRGMTALTARPGIAEPQRRLATQAMQAVGDVVWFDDEAMLDVATAISGSGPAYVFYFIEALQAAAREMGMDEAQARRFAVTTFAGAAELAAQSAEPVAVLRERGTSKGGTTAAALAKMADAGVAQAIVEAAQAALARSRELAQSYGR
ncbi:MAG TPA: pyrroline-5-carboxylate reductase [Burkholderiaceae bacterium]